MSVSDYSDKIKLIFCNQRSFEEDLSFQVDQDTKSWDGNLFETITNKIKSHFSIVNEFIICDDQTEEYGEELSSLAQLRIYCQEYGVLEQEVEDDEPNELIFYVIEHMDQTKMEYIEPFDHDQDNITLVIDNLKRTNGIDATAEVIDDLIISYLYTFKFMQSISGEREKYRRIRTKVYRSSEDFEDEFIEIFSDKEATPESESSDDISEDFDDDKNSKRKHKKRKIKKNKRKIKGKKRWAERKHNASKTSWRKLLQSVNFNRESILIITTSQKREYRVKMGSGAQIKGQSILFSITSSQYKLGGKRSPRYSYIWIIIINKAFNKIGIKTQEFDNEDDDDCDDYEEDEDGNPIYREPIPDRTSFDIINL